MKRLLIIGAQGQGKVVLDCAISTGQYGLFAFMTTEPENGGIKGYPLLDQNKTSIEYIKENFDEVIVAVGLNNQARLRVTNELEDKGLKIATLIHPSSTVSKFSKIGKGSVILANSVINPYATVGRACIINTGSIVEHDCIVEDGVHMSPNSTIAGRVHVGKCTWICMGSSVAHDITIGKNSTVGAGAVVLRDVPDNVLVAGIPAIIKKEYPQSE